MTEVGVHYDAKPLELVEIAVDSRHVNVRGAGLDLGQQVFGSAVRTGAEQAVQQEPARRCEPPAVSAEQLERRFDAVRSRRPWLGEWLCNRPHATSVCPATQASCSCRPIASTVARSQVPAERSA